MVLADIIDEFGFVLPKAISLQSLTAVILRSGCVLLVGKNGILHKTKLELRGHAAQRSFGTAACRRSFFPKINQRLSWAAEVLGTLYDPLYVAAGSIPENGASSGGSPNERR